MKEGLTRLSEPIEGDSYLARRLSANRKINDFLIVKEYIGNVGIFPSVY